MLRIQLAACILLSISVFACTQPSETNTAYEKAYEATWESLAEYDETADWFKDAKFGIYAHWGVLSVPAYANDWYPRNMHIVGSDEYKHHVETYGEPAEFGYHDFVPLFKAEEFDADKWAQLFVEAGARFGGLVAEHHDGWSNWDSEINPWNAADMGPKRDVFGELTAALRKQDLKVVASFHLARNLQLFQKDSSNWLNDTSYFPYNPAMPTSSNDPLLAKMYGNISPQQFAADWLGQLKEVIDQYAPDLIYFDGQTHKIPDTVRRQFLAHYFNSAFAKTQDVVVTHKEGEFPKSVSLEDFEKGRMNKITEEYWLTDETVSVGSWSYTNDLGLKSANEIIDVLVDVVSKNGALMLNVSPMANGIIPANQQAVLREIGAWLKTNGEAIYGSRTWEVFGEGPTKQERSGMFLDKLSYTDQDVRYTRKGKVIYATLLGWPGSEVDVTLTSFSEEVLGDQVPAVTKLSILGYAGEIAFRQSEEGLHFTTPESIGSEMAFVVKIESLK